MKKDKSWAHQRQKKRKIYASMAFLWLTGAFLLPKLAYASMVNDENIINLTNEVRTNEGLSNLSANQLLTKAAHDKAEAIFAAQEFKHDIAERKFSSWVKASGYEYQSVGENLAIDFSTSESAMEAWMDSPTHKKNILNPKFEEIGVAIKEDEFEGHKSLLVVQIFGKPSAGKITGSAVPDDVSFSEANTATVEEKDAMLLTHAAPKTLLVMRTMSGVEVYEKNAYLDDKNALRENLSSLSQTIIYIVDYSRSFLIEYYWTLIVIILGFFSYSFIIHKKNLGENQVKS